MSKRVAISLFIALAISTSGADAACSVTYSFTNGTTADATQVNQDFSDLSSGCAPLASPSFTGAVGIGMSPSNVLDITQNQNADSIVSILNNDAGATAIAGLGASNGSHYLAMNMFGTGSTNGIFGPGAAIYTDTGSSYGLGIGTIASSPLRFIVDTGEVSRFGTDGSFLVGTTTNGGWIGNAKLAIEGSTNTAGSVYSSSSSGRAFIVRVDNISVDLVDFNYSGTGIGSVTTNGTTTTYNTSSDARLKSNVVDLNAVKAEQALRAYRPQTYLLRGKPGIGALAQEVDRRFSAIGLDAGQIGLVTRGDGDPNLHEGQKGFRQWQMDSSKMVPFLVEAGIDHADRIKALEAQNVSLSRQVRGLLKSVALLERVNASHAERQARAATAKPQAR